MRPEGKKDIIMLCEEGLYNVPWMSGRVISTMTGGRYSATNYGTRVPPGVQEQMGLGRDPASNSGGRRVKIRGREIRKGGVEAGTELTSLSVNCRS